MVAMHYFNPLSNNPTGLPDSARPAGKIAVMAHDSKRDELVELLKECEPGLRRTQMVATHVTGMVCSQRLNMEIELLKSSVHGGDLQLCAMVVEGGVDAVIFLRDPLYGSHASDDLAALVRACDIHKVPIATNAATARAVLGHMARNPEGRSAPANGRVGESRAAESPRN